MLAAFGLAVWHVLLELAPWLLLGAAVAGTLHVLLPAGFVQRHLQGRWGVAKAVGLGVPLPLCSCGVIPTGLGLKKDGASDGASVGFLIATPQTGVDSVLVAASFLGWPFALFKVASAAITGLVGGWLTDAVAPRSAPAPAATRGAAATATTAGPRRRFRDGLDHADMLLRTIWRWLVVGILASAALQVLVPTGSLAVLRSHGGLLAMALTLAVSVPLYVCATASVPIAAALVASGFPPGAALVFLMAGPATNIATIGAVARTLGRRALVVYLGTIILGSVAFGLTFDFLLGTAADAAAAPAMHHGSPWAIAAAVVLIGLLLRFAAHDARRGMAPIIQTLENLMSNGEKAAPEVALPVEGMTCGGCVARLEKVLTRAEGVTSATVTLEPGRAVVAGAVSEARVRELIEQAGFDVPALAE